MLDKRNDMLRIMLMLITYFQRNYFSEKKIYIYFLENIFWRLVHTKSRKNGWRIPAV
jgi:hypothetical protein